MPWTSKQILQKPPTPPQKMKKMLKKTTSRHPHGPNPYPNPYPHLRCVEHAPQQLSTARRRAAQGQPQSAAGAFQNAQEEAWDAGLGAVETPHGETMENWQSGKRPGRMLDNSGKMWGRCRKSGRMLGNDQKIWCRKILELAEDSGKLWENIGKIWELGTQGI